MKSQPAVLARPPARLRMDPDLSRRGMLDGGWWPRSRDAATELSDLVALLSTRLGLITRVTLNVGDWDGVPRHLVVAGRRVRVGRFHGALHASVSVTILDQRRFEMLVVPPQTSQPHAVAAMRMAADVHNPLSARDILAAVARSPGVGSERPASAVEITPDADSLMR